MSEIYRSQLLPPDSRGLASEIALKEGEKDQDQNKQAQ
jgi:hypothetical protein